MRLKVPVHVDLFTDAATVDEPRYALAFKQSFGVRPNRYHMKRRIERPKTLLADPARSVTEIAVALGFRETSSFSAAFRQVTGRRTNRT